MGSRWKGLVYASREENGMSSLDADDITLTGCVFIYAVRGNIAIICIYTLFYGVASGNCCLAPNALLALVVSNNTRQRMSAGGRMISQIS